MKAGYILVAACIAASASAAQLYQWQDAQGHMVYSDQPPPPSIKNVQQKSFKGSFIEGGEPYVVKLARERYPITLYASDCGAPCDRARQFLSDRGVPYSSKDPQSSPDAKAELEKLTGHFSVPVLVVGADKFEGYEADQWQAAIDRAGYPKSALPGRKPAPSAAAPAPTAPPATP